MEDTEIIELYFNRDERAIKETGRKYGGFCHNLAYHILSVYEDAEECVNDTYLKAWNTIPPQKPPHLQAWLGRVVRNVSLDRWRKNHRKKRYSGMEQLLSELEECIPSSMNVEKRVEDKELTRLLNGWLSKLSTKDCMLFMRRYWLGESVKELAVSCGMNPTELANRMYVLRQKLKKYLEQEGIYE